MLELSCISHRLDHELSLIMVLPTSGDESLEGGGTGARYFLPKSCSGAKGVSMTKQTLPPLVFCMHQRWSDCQGISWDEDMFIMVAPQLPMYMFIR
jgi:hypothetical protein